MTGAIERGPVAARSLARLTVQYVSEQRRLGRLTGTSPRTIRYRLWLFVDHVGGDTDIKKVTRRKIEKWLLAMDVSQATRRARHSAVKTFLAWCVQQGYLMKNPAASVPAPRQPRNLPPRALEREQVAAIYMSCPTTREELTVSLMVQEGLRAAEVATLQVGDVDLDRMTLRVTGKGGHERALALSDETARIARRYREEHRLKAGPLVRSQLDPRRGIQPETVSRMVARVMHDAGVSETGHSLRHTAASDMLDNGAHIRTLQRVLGHTSLSTTERYMRAQVGDIREAMGGRSYRYSATGDSDHAGSSAGQLTDEAPRP